MKQALIALLLALAPAAALAADKTPGLALTAEYRYLMTGGVEVDKSRDRVNGTTRNANLSLDNVNHSVLVGMRYAFNAAPAVAAVAPAAAAETLAQWQRDGRYRKDVY